MEKLRRMESGHYAVVEESAGLASSSLVSALSLGIAEQI